MACLEKAKLQESPKLQNQFRLCIDTYLLFPASKTHSYVNILIKMYVFLFRTS